MINCTQEEMQRLQRWLSTLRKCGGWSLDEFRELLGVSKQTVCNLEGKDGSLTKMQYIAIRSILEYEAANDKKDNEMFLTAMGLVFNNEISEETREKSMPLVKSSAQSKMDKEVFKTCLAAIVGVSVAVITALTSVWISDSLRNKK